MKMSVCRTCLSKNELKPLFPPKSLSAKQLLTVTGIKIEPNDGLSQLICSPCTTLVNGAIKLRQQSAKSDKILKENFKLHINRHDSIISVQEKKISQNDSYKQISEQDIKIAQHDSCKQISNLENKFAQNDSYKQILKRENKIAEYDSCKQISKQENKFVQNDSYQQIWVQENKTSQNDSSKQISEQENKFAQNDSCKEISEGDELKIKLENNAKLDFSIKIEDYESSDDSDIMNEEEIEDVDLENVEGRRVCIEDFESSDSFDNEDIMLLEEESKAPKRNWVITEKEFLEREKRKMESKELDAKVMSLAVTPYGPYGPIRCRLCSKQIRNMANFKSHAKTHFEPQNACEECGKKFVNRSHMRYHQQRVHGRKKRLACSLCTYRAVDLQQLQNHKRAAHTGERPYICDVCGDSFRMRANIAQHMRKHFGIRNLQCERCPAMFRSRSELTNHQNRVHNHVYTYFCYLCTETYKRPASVKKHLVNIHGVSKSQQHPIKCVRTRR